MRGVICLMQVMIISLLLSSCKTLTAEDTEEPLVMVWDLITADEDSQDDETGEEYQYADILAPTWFGLEEADGRLYNLADLDYVQRAHENNRKVWAVFENKSDTDLTYQVLSDDNLRNSIIRQVVGYAKEYQLDGINIDFEALDYRTGPWFEQLVRDLYHELEPLHIIMSVDIPLDVHAINKIYDLKTINEYSDYIVIMAYDEHYDENLEIGPVASIDWVKAGIQEAFYYFGAEKIIMGIPFYTRIWIEDCRHEVAVTTAEIMGMAEALELFRQKANVWYREPGTEQVYAEIEEDNIYYKAWLEDTHSLSQKLDVICKYDLRGMAAWHLGMENREVQELINGYFH